MNEYIPFEELCKSFVRVIGSGVESDLKCITVTDCCKQIMSV